MGGRMVLSNKRISKDDFLDWGMMNYKHKFFIYVMLMSFLECGIYSYIFIQSVALLL